MQELVLGGARSGKSRYAEKQVIDGNYNRVVYFATAEVGDKEMAERIQHHRNSRPSEWLTVEEPCQLSAALKSHDKPGSALLVDCLTLWVTNCLIKECFESERDKLLTVISELKADIYMVSNEVGSGIVPMGELSRNFVDASGFLHQSLASICNKVTLVVAGIPTVLKSQEK